MSRFKNCVGIFNPESHGQEPILIVGVGGVGSVTAYYLAQIGCENITIVDFDEVEIHNTASQFYKDEDIGKLKVEALKDNIKAFTGIEVKPLNMLITKSDDIKRDDYKVVIVAVDNMDTRKLIIDSLGDQHCIETRMGGDLFTIFSFNPLFERDLWASYRFPQSEADPGICTQKSISYNTGMIGSLVTHKVKSMLRGEKVNFNTTFNFQTYDFFNHDFS